VFGLVAGLAAGSVSGLKAGLSVGLAVGLVAGLGFGLLNGLNALMAIPWGMFVLARAWLALRGKLPRDLMAFLADAHQRGVLRQVGAVYQFRHIELQRRLANR